MGRQFSVKRHIHTLFTCTTMLMYWTLLILRTLTEKRNAAYFSSLNGIANFTYITFNQENVLQERFEQRDIKSIPKRATPYAK